MNVYLHVIANYKYDVAEWLVNNGIADKAFVPYLPSYYTEKSCEYYQDKIGFIDLDELMNPEWSLRVSDKTPFNLGKEELRNLLKYESMYIHIASQRYILPTWEYDECKCRFIMLARFWKKFYLDNKIDYILFDDVPHWHVSYAAYAVAMECGIKVSIIAPIGMRVPGINGFVYVYGDSLETIGSSIEEDYKKGIFKNKNLNGLVKAYYEKSLEHNSEAAMKPSSRKTWTKYVLDAKYSVPNLLVPEVWALFNNAKYFASSLIKEHSLDRYKRRRVSKIDVRDLRRFHAFYDSEAVVLKKYDRIAKMPNENERYILFPLQLWPEATTTPLAGVFAEQYTAIQLLSSITKEYGIKIYVKEYYLQPYRERLFWEQLKDLENVVFIKSCVSSGELMKNAMAVANLTGTCLMEAPFYGVPSITFGEGFCLKGMPGLFYINDYPGGKQVIETIIDGVRIDLEELKNYYCALQNNSFFYHRTPIGKVEVGIEEYQLTVENLRKFVRKDLIDKGLLEEN